MMKLLKNTCCNEFVENTDCVKVTVAVKMMNTVVLFFVVAVVITIIIVDVK